MGRVCIRRWERRRFIEWLFLSLAPFAARAQPSAAKRRVAIVALGSLAQPPLASLVDGLRELGYVQGRNIEFEMPTEKGGHARLAELAARAVERKAEVIVSFGTTATQAASKATSAIPIVMVVGTDPVALGFVTNLARPEGNLTGFATASQLLVAKRVELLKEIVPNLRRLGVLWNPASAGQTEALRLVEQAAGRVGAAVHAFEIRSVADLQGASVALSKAKVDALVAVPSTQFLEFGDQIAQLAAAQKLPAVYTHSGFVLAGGLMAYSTDSAAQLRRAAVYVDRILKGAKPSDLPIEQPTKFELAINLKTARVLGIKFPQSILLRADQVIE